MGMIPWGRSGHHRRLAPGRVPVLDRFLAYAKSKDGVWFARKDEIARFALANPIPRPSSIAAHQASQASPGRQPEFHLMDKRRSPCRMH